MEMVGNVTTSRVVRASKLMLAVTAGLEIHPDKFESVLKVFREEQVYSEFSELIMDSLCKYKVVILCTVCIDMYRLTMSTYKWKVS